MGVCTGAFVLSGAKITLLGGFLFHDEALPRRAECFRHPLPKELD
jgi:hypothetical protein